MRKSSTRRGQTQKDVQNKTNLSRLFTSPLAGEDARRAGEGYKNKVILDLIQDLTTVIKAVRFRIKYGMTILFNGGFTLIELLVAIMIIGILAAVAVPQYQKAVMKSRFAAMMPIAKTLANANEVYYAEHDEYSTDPAKLNVTPQAGTPDGTAINMYSNPEEVSFVRVENPGVPNARYVVYQKLSENFPETTWCEAGDTRTEELCVALGGTLPAGVTGNSSGDNTNYKAYLLTGQARSGDTFAETGTGTESEPQTSTCPENSVCDEDGNVTGCSTGHVLNAGACEVDPTVAKLQTVANTRCPEGGTQYVCTIKNGYVYRCDTNYGTIDTQTGECVSNGTSAGVYESIYNADGKDIGYYQCYSVDSGHCYQMLNKIPAGDGFEIVSRTCSDKAAITKGGLCSNGYLSGTERTLDSHSNDTLNFVCSEADISTTTGKCNKYSIMFTYDNSYSTNGAQSYVEKRCPTASYSNPESTCSGSYQPTRSIQYNEAGTAYKEVKCWNSSNSVWTRLNTDGTCPSEYPYVKSYDSATKKYTTCGTTAASVNWETATCK